MSKQREFIRSCGAADKNGITTIDDVDYAIIDRPEISNAAIGVAFVSRGAAKNGNIVKLSWDCTDWFYSDQEDEFDCDWEHCATCSIP